MKKEHKPIPYAIAKHEGKEKINVRSNEKAEVAAQHLDDIFWGNKQENQNTKLAQKK